jgi:protoporphyrinogen oxidase
MENRKVVIAGGGITALACAYYLKKSGFDDFVILERMLESGGLCRSVVKNGFTFDMTGHVLWRMDAETKAFYEELLPDNLTWTERKAAIATKGVQVPYPFQAHLKNLPPQAAYECLSGFLSRERYLRGVDFESWCLSMFGDGITEHFMRPFNEKLFGVPLREMTWDWCQDVPVPTLDQIVRGAILGETFQMKGNAKFAYPKVGGMQALVDALLASVGSHVMTGRTVSKVDVERRIVEHTDFAGNINSFQYEHLVSTIPMTQMLKLVVPQDGKLKDFSFQLRANNVACVMLGFERPLTELHWLYTPDKEVPFYRLTFPSSTCKNTAPFGCGSAMAEITIPPTMTASVNDFVSSTLAGLRHLGLWESDQQNPVVAMHVEYIAPAYVIFDLAHRNVPKIVEGFQTMGVTCTGRFGKWDYTSVSDNVAEGRIAAKRILK